VQADPDPDGELPAGDGGVIDPQLGEPLLLTAATRELLREPTTLRELGAHPVRGVSAAVVLFAPE